MKYLALPSILSLSLILAACGGGGGGDGLADAAASQQTAALSASDSIAAPSQSSTSTADSATAPSTSTNTSTSSATPSTAPASNTSSTTSPSTSTPTSPTAGTTRVVDYYGDSTVWGYASGSGGQVATPAPSAFAQTVAGTTSKYTVRNEGVSGTTACDLLNGTDGRHPQWDKQMASTNATHVIINHAINDEFKYSLDTYKSCLRTLVRTAKAYGKTVILETPNPTRDSGPGGLDTMVAAMKEVATQEQASVIDQYQYLTSYLAGRSPYTICPDGLHPTAEVYIMKGQYAARTFSSLFPA